MDDPNQRCVVHNCHPRVCVDEHHGIGIDGKRTEAGPEPAPVLRSGIPELDARLARLLELADAARLLAQAIVEADDSRWVAGGSHIALGKARWDSVVHLAREVLDGAMTTPCARCGSTSLPLGFYSTSAPSLRRPLAQGAFYCPTCAAHIGLSPLSTGSRS